MDKERHSLAMKKYYLKNKQQLNEKTSRQSKERRTKLRKEIMDALGTCCSCCGESQYEFLTIDHINNDGAEERRVIGTGIPMLKHIITQGIPKDRYQILCANCNTAKYYHKVCPHKKVVVA